MGGEKLQYKQTHDLLPRQAQHKTNLEERTTQRGVGPVSTNILRRDLCPDPGRRQL